MKDKKLSHLLRVSETLLNDSDKTVSNRLKDFIN